MTPKPTRIHPTAIVEDGVEVGPGTAVWDHVHLRRGVRIGADCIIGEKSYLGPGVVVGDRVKVNAFVYLPTGVTVEDGVMLSAGTIFTNDRFPRATTPDLAALRTSEPDEHTLETTVGEGATVGAGAVIGCGFRIGRFAMVGMGSVVTRPVPDFHLVVGSPARTLGIVCRCGNPTARFRDTPLELDPVTCAACGRRYGIAGGAVVELSP